MHRLFVQDIKASKQLRNEISMRIELEEVSEIVPPAYNANNYFNKSRSWLHQRINGAVVNSKPAKFTDEEVKTLNFALKDIAKKIGSTKVSL
ncbi:MAG: DUF5053 domain-containing protein [Bacteroidetes bacterium]|nr:DUF5053 domain-containing protein [Bacteroidota bacterium]